MFRSLMPRACLAVFVPLLLPAAPPSDLETVRFLNQAAWGPSPALAQQVQQTGLDTYLNDQFSLPLPSYPTLTPYWPNSRPSDCTGNCQRDNYSIYQLQLRFYRRALTEPDQLRQRVASALNQIFVVSAVDGDLNMQQRMLPYLKILDKHAFGNFRDLMYDVTRNPGMGRYLDMAFNKKSAPNENYARELLQLFTIGLDELNPDGTPKLDANGNRIPTYTEDQVVAFAKAFTGWILAPQPATDVDNYFDPMVVRLDSSNKEIDHDTTAKTLLNGFTIPANTPAATELNLAIDNIFNHPNVGPFIGKLLIQKLVRSNPSPAYIARVTAAFNGQGGTPRGDMKATLRAILMDPEARPRILVNNGTQGHLKEPILYTTSLLRAFNVGDPTTDFVLGESYLPSQIRMAQDLYRSPSVFNFYSPSYTVPGTQMLGPEFGIYSSSTAFNRSNFAYEVIFKKMPIDTNNRPEGTWIDFSAWTAQAGDPERLVDALSRTLLGGPMKLRNKQVVIAAIADIPPSDALRRVQEAVYLITSSHKFLFVE
jgi:uncharacterized protein (DUF1800 family)